LKDLSPRAVLPEAAHARPSFLVDPAREIAVYRSGLVRTPPGAARFYGARADPARGRFWLFLEHVTGVPLWQVGELAVWRDVAAWLGRFHARAARLEIPWELRSRLVRHDAHFYRGWLDRARAFAKRSGPLAAPGRLDWLAERYEGVVERLTALPATVIHGEFFPSNVLVRAAGDDGRICPIDWETTALGSGLIDLAALTAGRWSEAARREKAQAYQAALDRAGGGALVPHDLMGALDLCRLHLAVQMLGWSADWSPPSAHSHDWLSEAMELAESLGL
jgi:aminoglycoside phosphotransferase (APT) family kinase protein